MRISIPHDDVDRIMMRCEFECADDPGTVCKFLWESYEVPAETTGGDPNWVDPFNTTTGDPYTTGSLPKGKCFSWAYIFRDEPDQFLVIRSPESIAVETTGVPVPEPGAGGLISALLVLALLRRFGKRS